MLLTDALLLDYKRCPRRAFLNLYGDSNEREPERDFLLKLRQESQHHVATVLAEFYPNSQQPQASDEDWQTKAKETEVLMQQGVDCIYRGVLIQPNYRDWGLVSEKVLGTQGDEPILFGTPHLLVKQSGLSKFGNWCYMPISIQLGRRPKPEYKLIAAFYAQLLATIQGVLPTTTEIVLRRQNRYAVDLAEWLPRMRETLAECLQMLLARQEPEVFISRQRCGLCHWYGHCYTLAQSQQHLSLVPGVTPSRYEYLQAIGVDTVASLADACPINLGETMGREVATQLKQQAKAIVENRAIRKSNGFLDVCKTIPTASIELYFDIEAEPERNLDYLLGILLVDRQKNSKCFYPFLAEKPEEEEIIWNQFLAVVNFYEHAPIFHFSEYEVETIKRLAHLYKTPRKQIESLLWRCIDLHKRVIHSVTFPVESYSLKALANWIGFQWRDRGASGDRCVCWYDRWLKTGDRSFLEAILRYNEDDCRATFELKDWLVEFLGKSESI
ncbi:recombinase B [Hydrococcus rivularis NIES-593]|uniref:Recombinase B n=1 Tax=Hydrococcus rivularis NIES-593 TaxID=1921803 RepID=A0A1U7HKI4_9CYAN|nr:TM0106 family RecB-like putative nuclease [Hydrococcus rivularis]OKH24064.1 recombinase B [Hydrococcus rivularis NIES-593]